LPGSDCAHSLIMNTIIPPRNLSEALRKIFPLGALGGEMGFLNLRLRSRFAGRPPTSL
jgi:hypothetical protein